MVSKMPNFLKRYLTNKISFRIISFYKTSKALYPIYLPNFNLYSVIKTKVRIIELFSGRQCNYKNLFLGNIVLDAVLISSGEDHTYLRGGSFVLFLL